MRMFIFLSVFFICACNQKDPEHIAEVKTISYSIDSLRNSFNLPLIPANFKLDRIGVDFCVWKAPVFDYPRFDAKSIFWDSTGIYLERNYFYKTPGERLQIYCFFRKVNGVDTTGVCHWYEKNQEDSGSFLTPAAAHIMLKEWGLNYQHRKFIRR